jgi:hypothetical protein
MNKISDILHYYVLTLLLCIAPENSTRKISLHSKMSNNNNFKMAKGLYKYLQEKGENSRKKGRYKIFTRKNVAWEQMKTWPNTTIT